VRAVLDIRQLPLSRKRGFSKVALAAILRQGGISYTHFPALGCPRPIRDRYKADGDWVAYARAFNSYLVNQEEALAEVVRIASKTPACLLCFEADFSRCHRSIIARSIAGGGGPRAMHLKIKEGSPEAYSPTAA
jgi:uncharacterized protein (DUF488 family)